MFNLQHLLGQNSILSCLPPCCLCLSRIYAHYLRGCRKSLQPGHLGNAKVHARVQLFNIFSTFEGYPSLLCPKAGITPGPKEIINSISQSKGLMQLTDCLAYERMLTTAMQVNHLQSIGRTIDVQSESVIQIVSLLMSSVLKNSETINYPSSNQ